MNTFSTLSSERATDADRPELMRLLQAVNLPTEDVPAQLTYFVVIRENGRIVASAGLEKFDESALVRSVAVDADYRNQHLGIRVYQTLEQLAREAGVRELYLITLSADGFFERRGFRRVERNAVPEIIQQTAQFSRICPASAVRMQKRMN